MERHDEQQKVGRRSRPLLQLTVVLVVMGALGMVWVTTRPSTSTGLHRVGDDRRGRSADSGGLPGTVATEHGLGIDVEHPNRTGGSGDRTTATYVLDGPERSPTDPDPTYFRVVTERGADDVWRAGSANDCEQWSSACPRRRCCHRGPVGTAQQLSAGLLVPCQATFGVPRNESSLGQGGRWGASRRWGGAVVLALGRARE